MDDLKSRPSSSPLFEAEMRRVCGWLKSAPALDARVAPYRRPYKRMPSRRPYFAVSKVATVAREASWGGVSYAALMDGLPRYGG